MKADLIAFNPLVWNILARSNQVEDEESPTQRGLKDIHLNAQIL
jgi:hypothetical protein